MVKEIMNFASCLATLTENKKPLIKNLTILAKENIDHVEIIVDNVQQYLEKVHPDNKLTVLYLVDSIMKNVGGVYTREFSKIIVNMFIKTFKKVDEKTRLRMVELRYTWSKVFSASTISKLDGAINAVNNKLLMKTNPQSQVNMGAALSFTEQESTLHRQKTQKTLVNRKRIHSPDKSSHIAPKRVISDRIQAIPKVFEKLMIINSNKKTNVESSVQIDKKVDSTVSSLVGKKLETVQVPDIFHSCKHHNEYRLMEIDDLKTSDIAVKLTNNEMERRNMNSENSVLKTNSDDTIKKKESQNNRGIFDILMDSLKQISGTLDREEADNNYEIKTYVNNGSCPTTNNIFGNVDLKVDTMTCTNGKILPKKHQDEAMSYIQDTDLRNNILHNKLEPNSFLSNVPVHVNHQTLRDIKTVHGNRSTMQPFDPRKQMAAPSCIDMRQEECLLLPYNRPECPPILGTPNVKLQPINVMKLLIREDPMNAIKIDGVPREIRFYGETAIIMLNWDDPREIKFLPNNRRIIFDNETSIVMNFNGENITTEVDKQVFDIRFGAPTRELYVNNQWYQCFFGGPPTEIVIDGKPRHIFLEGPPPQVHICKEKRTDLVAGKINLIVDAQYTYPIFLDAKLQKFQINGTLFTIRFVDSLRIVLINETPFKAEFGGIPRPIYVGDTKHFIRLTELPNNVKPGHINIANMETKAPVVKVDVAPKNEYHKNFVMDRQNNLPIHEKVPTPGKDNNHRDGFDFLLSLVPSSFASRSDEPLQSTNNKIPADQSPPHNLQLPANHVKDLFANLMATGVIESLTGISKNNEPIIEDKIKESKPKPAISNKDFIKPVDLLKRETLRVEQPGILAKLYGGTQCNSCGVRFRPEETLQYSQHLDWHFRQNRRQRDSKRIAHSRNWYYSSNEWMQYEEIEDLKQKKNNWFETTSATQARHEVPKEKVPSVRATSLHNQMCALCGDKFDQFYNEEEEEWHLRMAVNYEENHYHPSCLDDYKGTQSKKKELYEMHNTSDIDKSGNVKETTTKRNEIKVAIKMDDIHSESYSI